MPYRLANLRGILAKRWSGRPKLDPSFNLPPKQEVTDEVSDFNGILLVRLGKCSAMQVRLEPDRENVSFRIVPIAKATQVRGDSPWQAATDSQLYGWMRSGCALWQWLLAQGIDSGKMERRMAESVLPVMPRRRPSLFTLRSSNSTSLP